MEKIWSIFVGYHFWFAFKQIWLTRRSWDNVDKWKERKDNKESFNAGKEVKTKKYYNKTKRNLQDGRMNKRREKKNVDTERIK